MLRFPASSKHLFLLGCYPLDKIFLMGLEGANQRNLKDAGGVSWRTTGDARKAGARVAAAEGLA